MKVTRRNLVAAACALAVIIGVALWLYWPQKPQSTKPAPVAQGDVPTPSPSTPVPNVNANAIAAIPTEEEIKQRNERQIWLAYATPISVYGKVVDQNGNAVPGATVEIGIADSPLRTGSKYPQITDANGFFSLDSRGIAFSLRAFKEGYYTTDQSRGHRNVVVPTEGDTPQPTKDQPVILVLRKQGQTQALIAKGGGQIMVPKTGQPINVDLTTGRSGKGDLQISSWVGDNSQPRYDWRYQLTIPGGGIIERKGQFDFEAPIDGYQATAELNMPTTAEKWSIGAERDYFAKLSDGRYARFSVRFYPRRRNFVVIESYVNPTSGNRNLEFDPKKKTDQ